MPPANIANPEWPPRSPQAALLSTPSGRERYRRLQERASPSPSPIKRSASSASFRNRAKELAEADMDSDDDDEETLQLQLQEIQARLKLKKLQKKSKQNSDTENESTKGSSAPVGRSNSVAASRAQSRIDGIREARLERSKSQASMVQVPVSPVRRVQPPPPQRSPGRVLLGIDKGLKGSDISLKRAPSLRKREESAFKDRLAGPFLQRPVSQVGGRVASNASSSQDGERPKTFSERMAAVREQETQRQERELRVRKSRSQAFDIDPAQIENYKQTAVLIPEAPRVAPTFSRDEVVNSFSKPEANLLKSRTVPDLRSAMRNTSNASNTTTDTLASDRPTSRGSSKAPSRRRTKVPPNEMSESEATEFEPYSSIHLSKRIIPHQILTRTLAGKKTFLIPDLLKTVVGPDFDGPDVEEDIVVFGIIAKKSEPRAHQPNPNFKAPKRGKYMVMGLTDLKWELDLFLFDSAFEKFWKLIPGTIIAILNPIFMPPPKGKTDTGKFSLTLNSDTNTILELGMARDFGFCKSVKKDGKTCDTWVDKRHTEFCDYHVNLTFEKTKKGRMEVNTMTFGKGTYGKFKSRTYDPKTAETHREAEAQKKTRWDKESGTQIYISKKSAANLLDNVDYDPDSFHRGSSKEERMTRQVLAQEKERNLMKKLADMGTGQGAEYMRKGANPSSAQDEDDDPDSRLPPPPDAKALGLLGANAKDVQLSPISKRKRANTGSASQASAAAMGWGGGLTKELGRMREGGHLMGMGKAEQPVKKKTRFVTEKGIREAGRESIGGEAVGMSKGEHGGQRMVELDDDDDDDDLEIVR